MLNPKMLKVIASLGAVFNALRPLLFSVIGGFVVVGIQQCKEPKPVHIVLNNEVYENQLSKIQKTVDSVNRRVLTTDESLRYLSNRYAKQAAATESANK